MAELCTVLTTHWAHRENCYPTQSSPRASPANTKAAAKEHCDQRISLPQFHGLSSQHTEADTKFSLLFSFTIILVLSITHLSINAAHFHSSLGKNDNVILCNSDDWDCIFCKECLVVCPLLTEPKPPVHRKLFVHYTSLMVLQVTIEPHKMGPYAPTLVGFRTQYPSVYKRWQVKYLPLTQSNTRKQLDCRHWRCTWK